MKIIIVILLVLLAMLQYDIWLGEGGIPELLKLETETTVAQKDVKRLQDRNAALEAEVKDLKTGLEAIEERARNELGMIRKGEVYYQVIENKPDDADSSDKNKATQKNKPDAASKPKNKTP